MSKHYQIRFVAGEFLNETRELTETPLLVGRSRQCDVHYEALDVSGRQMELSVSSSGEVFMVNLSMHTVLLNGEELDANERCVLRGGDHICFGKGQEIEIVEAMTAASDVDRDKKDDGVETMATRFGTEGLTEATRFGAEGLTEATRFGAEGLTEATRFGTEGLTEATRFVDSVSRDHLVDKDKTEIPAEIPVAPVIHPVTPAPVNDNDDDDKTHVEHASGATRGGDDDEEEDGETMAMQTRVASVDELELLRKTRRKGLGRRVILAGVTLIVIAVCLGISWMVSATNIENPLTWPLGPNGEVNDEVILPEIGSGKDLLIYFPKYKNLQVVKEANRIMALTRLGRRLDVPCRVIFHMNQSKGNLDVARRVGFKAWCDKMMGEGGQWNFDIQTEIQFLGRDNGVPYQVAKYTRSIDNVSWFGVVMYMKWRDWELILQKEIPSSERYRGEWILENYSFMSVSKKFVLSHWSPTDKILDKTPIDQLVEESRQMLNRAVIAPRLWPQVIEQLRSVMIRSLKSNDSETYTKAVNLLVDLREKQILWLNAQEINYKTALSKNQEKRAAQIRNDCVAVFADEEDMRCRMLREGHWGE